MCFLIQPLPSWASHVFNDPLAPSALAGSIDGKSLYVACAAAESLLEFDLAASSMKRELRLPGSPSGLTLSADGRTLFVTCAAPESVVAAIDTETWTVKRTLAAGHTAVAPVLSRDGKTLFVCNRFNNEVAFINLETGKAMERVTVPREPIAAALTHDGRHLLVANHLHAGRADLDVVAATVSVIDTAKAKVVKEIALPNGSGLLREIAISPDGKVAALAHGLSRFHLPTTQIERGWINNNAVTLIDIASLSPINTVLLDNIDSGAATPWAVRWTSDGRQLIVTHAGTHEFSIIDVPALLEKLAKIPATLAPDAPRDYTVASRVAADVPNDLSFLVGLRTRVKLPVTDRGPRAMALIGRTVYAANYFSDNLTVAELASARPEVRSISLGAKPQLSAVRKGEFYFNDASICFQGWHSCAGCHSSDARVDAMNWDNLNDGIGNPKNVKSLLLAHSTPPSMWLGVRSNAYVGVRMGIKHSLFTVQPPEVAECLDAYLKSLEPIPSPHLVNGRLSASAQRGKELFHDEKVGCADCHKGKLLTDMKFHDVGTRSQYDKPTDQFDTPSLLEVWRTAPYLHDGSAPTIRDVLTTRNPKEEHGVVSHLTPQQLEDLIAFVSSL